MLSGINLGSRKGIGGVELGSNSLSSIPSSGGSPTVFTLVLDDLLTRFVEYVDGTPTIQFALTTGAGTTGSIYLDSNGSTAPPTNIIADVNDLAANIQSELESLAGYSGKVTVSGASTNAGDTYTFTITFDGSLGAVTLDFDGSSQWYPTITLTEEVSQQGAEIVYPFVWLQCDIDMDGNGFVQDSVSNSITIVSGTPTATPASDWSKSGDADNVVFTYNLASSVGTPIISSGSGSILSSGDYQPAIAEIHGINPLPVTPTGGTWKPCSGSSAISYNAGAVSIQAQIGVVFDPLGSSNSTVTGTLDAGSVAVEAPNGGVLSDTALSPVNVSLTAPEITHSIN